MIKNETVRASPITHGKILVLHHWLIMIFMHKGQEQVKLFGLYFVTIFANVVRHLFLYLMNLELKVN